MKSIFIGAILALPLAITSIPSQALAAEIIVRPVVHQDNVIVRRVVRPNRRVIRQNRRFVNRNRRVVRQRLIPGRWERTRYGRRWVPARYVRF